MFISRNNIILEHMILFFIKKFNYKLTKTLLMKLLWETDRRHFQETGTPMSSLEYKALPYGPVPTDVLNGLDDKTESKISEYVQSKFTKKLINTTQIIQAKDKIQFDKSEFSRRQQRILEEVYTIYINSNASTASEASHQNGKEWDTVYNKQNKKNQKIPYGLILDCMDTELSNEIKAELLEKWAEYQYDQKYMDH